MGRLSNQESDQQQQSAFNVQNQSTSVLNPQAHEKAVDMSTHDSYGNTQSNGDLFAGIPIETHGKENVAVSFGDYKWIGSCQSR